ncbi:MAG: hypothetical protein AAF387_11255 [Pseudomonadota bacterium]
MSDSSAVEAQARIHHAYFLGLQLAVNAEYGAEITGEWIYRLFRQQHDQYFLASFNKLGLEHLPHAVACARYHVLSNSIGGVPVEYAEESSTKAWVRFRYPRWMFAGPTICGVPKESGRGFLNGWYARNGISLNNPRLGFVCVSEDVTGEFGFCGYFKEFDRELSDEERLQFAKDERPPPFNANEQPDLPQGNWSEERLAKANRNYAVAYVKNGITTLSAIVGSKAAQQLGGRSARLIGLQYYAELAELIGATDGDYIASAEFLEQMFRGMDDEVLRIPTLNESSVTVKQSTLRIVNGLSGQDREDLLSCWIELWRGTVDAHRRFKTLRVDIADDVIKWIIADQVTDQHD